MSFTDFFRAKKPAPALVGAETTQDIHVAGDPSDALQSYLRPGDRIRVTGNSAELLSASGAVRRRANDVRKPAEQERAWAKEASNPSTDRDGQKIKDGHRIVAVKGDARVEGERIAAAHPNLKRAPFASAESCAFEDASGKVIIEIRDTRSPQEFAADAQSARAEKDVARAEAQRTAWRTATSSTQNVSRAQMVTWSRFRPPPVVAAASAPEKSSPAIQAHIVRSEARALDAELARDLGRNPTQNSAADHARRNTAHDVDGLGRDLRAQGRPEPEVRARMVVEARWQGFSDAHPEHAQKLRGLFAAAGKDMTPEQREVMRAAIITSHSTSGLQQLATAPRGVAELGDRMSALAAAHGRGEAQEATGGAQRETSVERSDGLVAEMDARIDEAASEAAAPGEGPEQSEGPADHEQGDENGRSHDM